MDEANWGWVAGLVFIAFTWAIYVGLTAASTGKADWLMKRLWQGEDLRGSFSKFQFWLWSYVIAFAMFSIWVARMITENDIVTPFEEVPENILIILGLSTGTALGAKAITTTYVNLGFVQKARRGAAMAGPNPNPPPGDQSPRFSDLLADDQGRPDLANFQMLVFSLLTMVVFLTNVGDVIAKGDKGTVELPDVAPAFMVLMGLSAGGYTGKKAVTRDPPTITSVTPASPTAGSEVMLLGASLGDRSTGTLLVGDRLYTADQIPVAQWTNSKVVFTAPEGQTGPQEVKVIANNVASNAHAFNLTQPRPSPQV